MSTKNIVLFGETGAGKSSVVNLMAGREVAKTSPDMERCTLHWKEHLIAFDGHQYKVFDTVGLEEPQLGMREYLEIIENAYNLITKLQNEGGIDLLLFCVRAGRVTATLQTNYRLFYEWLCESRVPIVLVLTGLERENNMEDWWDRNARVFDQYGIKVDGHACITAANRLDGRHKDLYALSQTLVRDLVIEHTSGQRSVPFDDGFFHRFIRALKELIRGNRPPKKRDVVAILTKRCGMPPEAAKKLAQNIGKKGEEGS